MTAHLCQVFQVLPDRHGVLVTFRDGTWTPDTQQTFCRVLARRAHPKGGASTELPEVGELGMVMELDGGFHIWMGSLHYQAEGENQVEPELGARVDRDSAGLVRRSRANGDAEWSHPSGLRITVSEDGQALPDLQRPGSPKNSKAPALELEHPSGAKVTITKEGDLTILGPSGAKLAVSKDGALVMESCESIKFQGGAKKFAMEDLYTWAQTHTHTCTSPGSPSSAPITAPPASSVSPATFTGPAGA